MQATSPLPTAHEGLERSARRSDHGFARQAIRSTSGLLMLLLLVAAEAGPARAFVHYMWKTAVNGSTDETSKWTPAGLPAFADYLHFNLAGTYTVTFPATTPTTFNLSCNAGNVTWSMASPHTTTGLEIGPPSGTMTLMLNGGQINWDYLQLGFAGGSCTMTLSNAGPMAPGITVHSRGMNNPYSGTFGDHIGYAGISELDVFGGAQYFSDQVGGSWPLDLGSTSNGTTTLAVAGFCSVPFRWSRVIVGANGMIIGNSGVANVFAYNGGFIESAGDIIVGANPSSNGYVTTGPTTLGATSWINAGANLLIGNNGIGPEAGHGELTVRDHSFVHVAGHTVIGDPDNVVDKTSVLHVRQGGSFVANDGLRVWPTAGIALDLRGGQTILNGGELRWPASKFFTLSSTVGTPELWLRTGGPNTGPSTPASNAQLYVARSGTGTLRVTRAGTTLTMGLGATTLGDSIGGTGTVVVDSLAHVVTGGPWNVGVRGTGVLQVRGIHPAIPSPGYDVTRGGVARSMGQAAA
jgi:hypothetical protein